jgi:urocanate hydratase
VALHNGGGTGIGKAVNGGFGMVCDGSRRVDGILRSAMLWDVMGGVARRSWARNPHAMQTVEAFSRTRGRDYSITMPYLADETMLSQLIH